MYIPVMKELNADDFCEMFLLGRDVRAIEAMEASHSLFKTHYVSAYRKRIDDVFSDHGLLLPRHYTKEDVFNILSKYDESARNIAYAGYFAYGMIHDLQKDNDMIALEKKWNEILTKAYEESPDYGKMVFQDVRTCFTKDEGVDNIFKAYMKKSYQDTYNKSI